MSSLRVAYFTMEIAAKPGIPTFAGGLGILAGDVMHSCADLGVSAAGVSICWQFGYLHQTIKENGKQEYESVVWNPADHLTLLPARVSVQVEGRTVSLAAWELVMPASKGSDADGKQGVPVYFLDSNLPENSAEDREITKSLYGGDQSMRIKQEIVLGIGGVKMLRALGYTDIKTFHMNEGHCAFLTLELLKERQFNDAAVKASCAFTTHTPVKAGHDVFGYDLVWKIVGDMLPWHIKKLAGEEALSMTHLAMNMSRYTCGVSKVHEGVARGMLNNPNIDSITNGIHTYTWASPEISRLLDTYLPDWRKDPSVLKEGAMMLPDDALWAAHQMAKERLIKEVHKASGVQLKSDVLTISGARRVVPYKRPELLYTNIARLKEIGGGKLQIIHAGNAHPHDAFAQEVIEHMIAHSKELSDSVKIAYLPNYNPELARLLVSGSDVWLNTPLRLHEASGTSGMKACLNGVPNLSTLDGWFVEGYGMDPGAGWRIGPLAPALSPEDTRAIDAEDLYTQLQYQVIPTYSDSTEWISRMKRAMQLAGHFSTQRAVGEYLAKAWLAE